VLFEPWDSRIKPQTAAAARPRDLPNSPRAFRLGCTLRRGFPGFVSACESGWAGFRSLHVGSRSEGVFEKQLLALAAEQEKFQDFSHHALADFARGGVLGGANRSRHAEHLQRALELFQNATLAIDHLICVRTIESEVGIFFIHEEIQFVAEGIIMFKGGKSVHVEHYKAKLVPATKEAQPLWKKAWNVLISLFDEQLTNPRLVAISDIDRAKGAFLVKKEDGREGIDAEIADERASPPLAIASGGPRGNAKASHDLRGRGFVLVEANSGNGELVGGQLGERVAESFDPKQARQGVAGPENEQDDPAAHRVEMEGPALDRGKFELQRLIQKLKALEVIGDALIEGWFCGKPSGLIQKLAF